MFRRFRLSFFGFGFGFGICFLEFGIWFFEVFGFGFGFLVFFGGILGILGLVRDPDPNPKIIRWADFIA